MRVRVVALLIAVAMVSVPRGAEAQRQRGPHQVPYCGSQPSRDGCFAQTLAVLLARLELPTAETLAEQGYSGIRIFHYDAFENIWPAVTVISRPISTYRRDGIVEARSVHADGLVAVLSRPIWEGAWRRADEVVTAVNDRPQPPPAQAWDPASGAPPPPAPCADAPVDIVEVIADGQVARWAPVTCPTDPTFRQAESLWEMAAAAFPACGHLPIEKYGYGIGRLRACLMLGGSDPASAIPVLEGLDADYQGHLNRLPETTLYDPNVRLIVGEGAPVVGPAAVDGALRAGALGPGWIRIVRASGDGERVTVHGLRNAVPPAVAPPIPFTQVWIISPHSSPQMIEWRVAPRMDQGSD